MKVKKALFSNLLAGGWTKISIVLVRLVQVPLILLALGVEDYGRWLVLSSISTWLNLANIGFGDVAANEMPMAIAAGDFDKAKERYTYYYNLCKQKGYDMHVDGATNDLRSLINTNHYKEQAADIIKNVFSETP